MAFQTVGARRVASLQNICGTCGALWSLATLVECLRNCCETLISGPDHPTARGTLEPSWNPHNLAKPYLAKSGGSVVDPPLQNLVEELPGKPWWNALLEPYLKPPEHPAVLAERGETLVELVEPYLKPPRTQQTWWNPGGTLVEPYLKPPRTTPQPSQNLVEPCWRTLPQTTPDHPAALAEPGGSLVEPSWNRTLGGTLVEPYLKPPRPPRSPRRTWNPGQTLVEPYLKPPRTTPLCLTPYLPPGKNLWRIMLNFGAFCQRMLGL